MPGTVLGWPRQGRGGGGAGSRACPHLLAPAAPAAGASPPGQHGRPAGSHTGVPWAVTSHLHACSCAAAGRGCVGCFQVRGCSQHKRKIPISPQAVNRDVAWPRSCTLVWAQWVCAATPGPTPHIPPVPIPSPGQRPSQTHTGHCWAPPCLPRGPSATTSCHGTHLICEILPGAVGHIEQDKPMAHEAVPAAPRTSGQLPSALSAAPVFDGHG